MLKERYQLFCTRIEQQIEKNRIYTKKADTLAYGTDASFYRLIPQVVIQSKDEAEITFILQVAYEMNLAVTFRGAGTSLSGQAISDSILVYTSKFWNKLEVLDNGKSIRLQPGVIGSRANAALKPYGKKIGPDPASINSAMIGGIAANNASGMCCGTAQNSYKTLKGMKIVFYDGFVLNTEDSESIVSFKIQHAKIYNGVLELMKNTKCNKGLNDRIREKFKMKNTTGYSLNALVDFTDPIDVIAHLMIGSEGTLGMISEISYQTVVDAPFKASALMIFESIEKACNVVSILKSAPVSAVELMDRASLRAVQDMDGVPSYLKDLGANSSALLVETVAGSKNLLLHNIQDIIDSIDWIQPEIPFEFTDLPVVYNQYWKIRKGLFPSVGAIRKIGTTVIIEDITFPVSQLAKATLDLQNLFKDFQYDNAVIFGHALEGNLHFVFTQDFEQQSEIKRYEEFIEALTCLVVDKYNGALKSEHGTGRNMAPFVEKEWGKDAFHLMKQIKHIFDPKTILNPGVIINSDKKAHLRNLKPLPQADEQIDKCIECGFCESHCVSNNLGYSPRQRIVLHREMNRLHAQGNHKEAKEFEKSFEYGFDSLCATDGLCVNGCPVKINTGDYVKKIRSRKNGKNPIASIVAKNMGTVVNGVRVGLKVAHGVSNAIGDNYFTKIMPITTGLLGKKTYWNKYMPKASSFKPIPVESKLAPLKVVYFTSCINRMMGPSKPIHRHKKQFMS